jgi:hypothetical protein
MPDDRWISIQEEGGPEKSDFYQVVLFDLTTKKTEIGHVHYERYSYNWDVVGKIVYYWRKNLPIPKVEIPEDTLRFLELWDKGKNNERI